MRQEAVSYEGQPPRNLPGKTMRTIERMMNKAIAEYKNKTIRNTRVSVTEDVTTVRLYGKLIAELGDNYITLHDGGSRSATVKRRLNAILQGNGSGGERIYQRNGVWRIQYDGKDERFYPGMTI